jgi:uncharacterized membrane protein
VTGLLFSSIMSALCIVGLYAAVSMEAKARRYARGELAAPSVVQQPRARMFGGMSNSSFGIAYYAAMLVAVWLLAVPYVYPAALVASVAAAALSFYLAYSLLFITRMPCPFCWTGHVVNVSLLALLLLYPVVH